MVSLQGKYSGWIPYVEVEDVDQAAALAQELDGTVERAPFEVPGVGRNCLVRDPVGALIGISLSRHDFPTPKKQFGAERYVARSQDFPADFYRGLFNWSIQPSDGLGVGKLSITLAGEQVALQTRTEKHPGTEPSWVPSVRVMRLSSALLKVRALEGSIANPERSGPNENDSMLVSDPNGSHVYLIVC